MSDWSGSWHDWDSDDDAWMVGQPAVPPANISRNIIADGRRLADARRRLRHAAADAPADAPDTTLRAAAVAAAEPSTVDDGQAASANDERALRCECRAATRDMAPPNNEEFGLFDEGSEFASLLAGAESHGFQSKNSPRAPVARSTAACRLDARRRDGPCGWLHFHGACYHDRPRTYVGASLAVLPSSNLSVALKLHLPLANGRLSPDAPSTLEEKLKAKHLMQLKKLKRRQATQLFKQRKAHSKGARLGASVRKLRVM